MKTTFHIWRFWSSQYINIILSVIMKLCIPLCGLGITWERLNPYMSLCLGDNESTKQWHHCSWVGGIMIGVCNKHMEGESLNWYHEVKMCNQVFAVTKITGDYMYVSNACLIASHFLLPPQRYFVVLSSPCQIHNQWTLSCIWLVRNLSNHNLCAHFLIIISVI